MEEQIEQELFNTKDHNHVELDYDQEMTRKKYSSALIPSNRSEDTSHSDHRIEITQNEQVANQNLEIRTQNVEGTQILKKEIQIIEQYTQNTELKSPLEQRTIRIEQNTQVIEHKSAFEREHIEQRAKDIEQNIEHKSQQYTLYVVQTLQILALEQVVQNFEHTTQNTDTNTNKADQDLVLNSYKETSPSTVVSARKRKKNEIDIPENPDWDDDEFYDNGFRKHKLRDKSAKKINISPIKNVQPIKEVVKKVKKTIKKSKGSKQKPKLKKTVESLTDWYDCPICNTNYTTPGGLLSHMGRKHNNLKFTCLICSAIFNSNTLLLKHKTTHNNEIIIHQCNDCYEAFDDHCKYLIHNLKHQTDTFYKCLECGRLYFRKSGMEEHIYTHFEARIKCKLCSLKFRKQYMSKHMESHTRVQTCVECGKTYKTKGSLDYHMISHTGLKLHQCYYCGKCFGTFTARDVHLSTHTKEKPFECKICFGKYAQRSTLDKHMITHEAEPRYHCDICTKKFRTRLSLLNHLSIHSNTQKYPCTLCKKPLSTLQGLGKHMLYKHSNQRTHHCKVCDKWYKNNQAIIQHNTRKSHIRNAYAAAKKANENKIKD